MEIKSAEFIISNASVSKCPRHHAAGIRLHRALKRGKIQFDQHADQSQETGQDFGHAGKTLLINHFLINKTWYLVDLPGYGYAKRGKRNRRTCAKSSLLIYCTANK